MLTTAGQNIDRLHSEASFAAICGASPIPASSGKTTVIASTPAGIVKSTAPLHLIAVCRLRYCQRTRTYAERRTRDGKTHREIMPCLKRYIAREIYNTLQADLADLGPRPPRRMTAIHCSNPGHGITRKRA